LTLRNRSIIYRPFTLTYLLVLFISTLALFLIMIYTVPILVRGLRIPPPIALLIFYLTLIGSYVNIPLTSIETVEPTVTFKQVRFFGITWIIPELGWGVRETIIAINFGGAIIPTALSLFLLLYNIPKYEPSPLATYVKVAIALILISYFMKKTARIVPGLGIAVPAMLPPIVTAIISLILYQIPPQSNPSVIAYISGTFGTLIGADLLNLRNVTKVRARIVSIGGAGTFDGIYLTGLIATALTLIA